MNSCDRMFMNLLCLIRNPLCTTFLKKTKYIADIMRFILFLHDSGKNFAGVVDKSRLVDDILMIIILMELLPSENRNPT